MNSRTKIFLPISEKLWVIAVLLAFSIRILDGIRIPLYMDELPILYNIAHFLKHKTFMPSHFNYPTLFSYLITFPTLILFMVYYLVSGFPLAGLVNSQWMSFLFSSNLSILVWAGRSVSILLSILTIILVYFFVRRKYGLIPALISIFILSVDPSGGRFITLSRYSLPDVAAAFFATGSMILGFIFLEKKQLKWLFGSALVAGLAVSTKYNAGLIGIPLIYLCFVHREPGYWKRLFWIPALFLVGFLAGSPGWILNPNQFLQGYLFEAEHMQEGHLGQFGQDWIWIFKYLWSCKTILLPALIMTTLFALIKRSKMDLFFLFLILPAFLVIGRFEKKSIHYFLFLYPVLTIFIGRFVHIIEARYFHNRWRWIYIAFLVTLFFIHPFYKLIPKLKKDFSVKCRFKTEKWIVANIPSGSTLILDRIMLPNLLDTMEVNDQVQTMKAANNEMWRDVALYYKDRPSYYLMPIQNYWNDIDSLLREDFPYVVISSYNYKRFFSDTIKQPDQASPLFNDYMKRKAFYTYFLSSKEKKYRQIIRIKSKAGQQIRVYQRIP